MTANCANYANVAALPLVIGQLPLKNELAGTGLTKLVWAGCGRNGQDGGEAPAMRVGPMVLPLILSVTFVSRRKEQDECLDGFVPRNDAKRAWGRSPEKLETHSPNKNRADRSVSPI